MTTLKTPEKVADDYEWVLGWSQDMNIEAVLTKDRQAIAQVLCDLLEGEKREPHSDGYIESAIDALADEEYNKALTKAQAIIRQTLEGKQE